MKVWIGLKAMIVVDLYPFEETVKAGKSEEDIIEKIDSGISGVLGGVSNLIGLVGGFDPAGFLRGAESAIAGIAGLLSCNESASDYNKPTNVWTIGMGAKSSSTPSFKDIMKSASDAEALFRTTRDSIQGTGSKIKFAKIGRAHV